MVRIWHLLVVVVGLGICAVSLADRHHDGESVRVISAQDIVEKLDGQETKATTVEVTIGPGESGVAHRHPGPGFVYILEGEYELGIDDLPVKKFKAGETFYEPTGCLHRISRNPSTK